MGLAQADIPEPTVQQVTAPNGQKQPVEATGATKPTSIAENKKTAAAESLTPTMKLSEFVEGAAVKDVTLDPKLEAALFKFTQRRLQNLQDHGIKLGDKDQLLKKIHEQAEARQTRIEALRTGKQLEQLKGNERIYLTAQEVTTVLSSLEGEIMEDVDSLGYSLTKDGQKLHTFTLPPEKTITLKAGIHKRAMEALGAMFESAGAKIVSPFADKTFTVEFAALTERVVTQYAQGTFLGLPDGDKLNYLLELEQMRYGLYESLGLDLSKTEDLALINLSPKDFDPQADPLSRGRSKIKLHNLTVAKIEKLLEIKGKSFSQLTDSERIILRDEARESAILDFNTETGIGILEELKSEAHKVDQLDKLKAMAAQQGNLTPERVQEYKAELERLKIEEANAKETQKRVDNAIKRIDKIEDSEKTVGLIAIEEAKKVQAESDINAFQEKYHGSEPDRQTYLAKQVGQWTSDISALKGQEKSLEGRITILETEKTELEKHKDFEKNSTYISVKDDIKRITGERNHLTEERKSLEEKVKNNDQELEKLSVFRKNLGEANGNIKLLEEELKDLYKIAGNTPQERVILLQTLNNQIESITNQYTERQNFITTGKAAPEDQEVGSVMMKMYNILTDDYNNILEGFSNAGSHKRIDLRELSDPSHPETVYRNFLNAIFEANTDPNKSLRLTLQQRLLSPYDLAKEIANFYGLKLDPAVFNDPQLNNLGKDIVDKAQRLNQIMSRKKPSRTDITTAQQELQQANNAYLQFQFDALKSVCPQIAGHSRVEAAELVRTIIDHRYEAALSGNPFSETVYQVKPEGPRVETVVHPNVGKAEIQEPHFENGKVVAEPIKVSYEIDDKTLGGKLRVEELVDLPNKIRYKVLLNASQELLDRLPPKRDDATNEHWPLAIINRFYGPNGTDEKRSEAVSNEFIEIKNDIATDFDEATDRIAAQLPPSVDPFTTLRNLLPAAFSETALRYTQEERIKLFSGFKEVPINIGAKSYKISLDSKGEFTINDSINVIELNNFLENYAEKERIRLHADQPLTPQERKITEQDLLRLKVDIGNEVLRALQSRKI